MNRTDIDADAQNLESRLFSKASQKNLRTQFVIAQSDGEKISSQYKAYLDKYSKYPADQRELKPRQQIELADAYFNYALHLTTLRAYYFLCYQQNPIKSLEPNYLMLALKQSELALENFNKAHTLYLSQSDKTSTQAVWDQHKRYHDDVERALASKKRVRPKTSHEKNQGKRQKLTIDTSFSGPFFSFASQTSSSTQTTPSRQSQHTPSSREALNLSALEAIRNEMESTGSVPPMTPDELRLIENNLFQEPKVF